LDLYRGLRRWEGERLCLDQALQRALILRRVEVALGLALAVGGSPQILPRGVRVVEVLEVRVVVVEVVVEVYGPQLSVGGVVMEPVCSRRIDHALPLAPIPP
jgi:hypothetical protein